MKKLLAIDPGNCLSAFVVLEGYRPIRFAKAKNDAILRLLRDDWHAGDPVVLERVASFGMAVGRDVFETCEWVGRFAQTALDNGCAVHYVFRNEEKMNICHDSRAKDANIRRALIDRFAGHDLKNGKGTKRNPDFFYGFSKDVWAAFAVGVTWLDRQKACEG